MIYLDFVNSKKSENLKLAQEILNKNRTVYKIQDSNEEAYLNIVTSLKMILGLNDKDIKSDLIFDGKKDGSIDAIKIDKKERTIHVFDVKKTDKFERGEIINDFLGEFKRNFLDFKTDLKPLNQLACSKTLLARDAYLNKGYKVIIYFVRIGFCGDCLAVNKRYQKNIDKEFLSCSNISYQFIGSEELVSRYFGKNSNTFSHQLVFDDNNIFYDKNNKVAVGKIKIKDIIEMIQSAEGKSSYNIFDDNVRVDQENETLDIDLMKTLENNKERFFLFHNGITISSSSLVSATGKKFNLINPQVLNGCQSVKSLQRIYIKNKKLISNSLILCRLFEGINSDDVNAVCQSTNSQRPIYTWDLRANDLIQKSLEVLLVSGGYSYNRKIIRKGVIKKVIITDLAQWIESCINRRPAAAKSNKKGLFDITNGADSDYFKNIFTIKHKTKDILKVCSVCIFVKDTLSKIKKTYKKKEDRSFLDHANMHIMAYVYNYGEESEADVLNAIKVCQNAAEKMRKEYGNDYSNNNIFKNPKTWFKYINKGINN